MPIATPITPYSKPFGQWAQDLFIHPSMKKPSNENVDTDNTKGLNLKKVSKSIFLKTYGIDGYNFTSTELTTSNPDGYAYINRLKTKIALMSFFGIPNRLIEDGYIDRWQVAKNFIGGWSSADQVGAEKRSWQWLALFTVKPIIAVIKVGTLIPKTALNTVKLFTEFTPALISHYSAEGVGSVKNLLSKQWYKTQADGTVSSEALEDLDMLESPSRASRAWAATKHHVSRALALVGLAIGFVTLTALHATARIFNLAGRLITSPEKSVQLAFATGRELNLTILGDREKLAQGFATAIGVIAALTSLALTVVFWAIALPLAIGAVIAVVPAVVPAVTWLASLPVIAPSLAALSGALGAVGATIGTTFGPAATALASVIGLNLTVSTLAVGTTLGVILAPVATTGSMVSDRFSNGYARWTEGGPVAYALNSVKAFAKGSAAFASAGYAKLPNVRKGKVAGDAKTAGADSDSEDTYADTQPSKKAEGLVGEQAAARKAADQDPEFSNEDSFGQAADRRRDQQPVRDAQRSTSPSLGSSSREFL